MKGKRSRAAFAAALTVFVLGSLVSFGGVSYAASGASHALSTAKRVTVTSHPRVRALSAASDEYSTAPTIKGSVKGTAAATSKPKPKKPVSATPPPTVPTSQLPFTGLSLLGTSLVGFGLIGLGVALRRRERRGND